MNVISRPSPLTRNTHYRNYQSRLLFFEKFHSVWVSSVKRVFDDLLVDLSAELHALLEVALVIAFGALRLNVLIDRVNLGLVADKAFLNVVEAHVDVGLKDLVLARVVFDRVIGGLLLHRVLVLANELLDGGDAFLFLFELCAQVVNACKLVGHVVLHAVDAVRDCGHLRVDAAL